MPAPKNIEELNVQLLDAFEQLKNDPRRHNQVKEMTNAAGKVMMGLKLQMVYSLARGEEPEIGFMGKTSGKQLKHNAKVISG